ncbi:MAG: PQQ-dependent sugar dehydrogenase [Chloroflexota bacterium]
MMKRILLILLLVVASSIIVSAQDDETMADEPVLYRDSIPSVDTLAFEPVVTNLIRPLLVTHAGDGSGRLFIVEQRGRINIWDGESLEIFMDISNLISQEALGTGYTERGLLGLAFHPDYAENGTFFVYYTDTSGGTVIARYQVSDDPNSADLGSAEVIFTTNQPYANHNGGHMAFDADGYLYVALGDGGSAGDPLNAGQNPDLLLGTIMRLDVDTETGYAIPEDNPFVNQQVGANEVWSYGWRNPWRFSFDRATDDMYIGDVGQAQWEEVNFEAADSVGGLNYGWKFFEATRVYEAGGNQAETVVPFAEYNHANGNCSVTAGYVYRGELLPDWNGVFFYGDFCSGQLWTAYRTDAETWVDDVLTDTDFQISSFGEDEDGEIYIVNYGGSVLKVVPAE